MIKRGERREEGERKKRSGKEDVQGGRKKGRRKKGEGEGGRNSRGRDLETGGKRERRYLHLICPFLVSLEPLEHQFHLVIWFYRVILRKIN